MDYSKIVEEIIKLDLKKITVIDFKIKENILLFTVKGNRKYCKCPNCGASTSKKQDLAFYKSKTPLKHLVLSDTKLIVKIISG